MPKANCTLHPKLLATKGTSSNVERAVLAFQEAPFSVLEAWTSCCRLLDSICDISLLQQPVLSSDQDWNLAMSGPISASRRLPIPRGMRWNLPHIHKLRIQFRRRVLSSDNRRGRLKLKSRARYLPLPKKRIRNTTCLPSSPINWPNCGVPTVLYTAVGFL
jgi:hypothetical protein